MNTEDRSGQSPTRGGQMIQYPLDHGGKHFVDLHRDNAQGSQNATDRQPEKVATAQ